MSAVYDQPPISGCIFCGKPVRIRKDGAWICAECYEDNRITEDDEHVHSLLCIGCRKPFVLGDFYLEIHTYGDPDGAIRWLHLTCPRTARSGDHDDTEADASARIDAVGYVECSRCRSDRHGLPTSWSGCMTCGTSLGRRTPASARYPRPWRILDTAPWRRTCATSTWCPAVRPRSQRRCRSWRAATGLTEAYPNYPVAQL